MNDPEPWLRGPMEGVHPLVMPIFFSFAQVREDLAKHTAGLDREALWRPLGNSSLGFQLQHLAGSIDRLTTYLMGGQLTERQLETLRREAEPEGDLRALLEQLEAQLASTEEELHRLDPKSLYESRSVGRRALPTTVIGLVVHICEHTQRHLGQAITLAKILRQP